MGFTRGWREFSLAEDLSDGDVCVFELLDTTDLMFRVHVFPTERKSPSSQKKDSSNQDDHHHRPMQGQRDCSCKMTTTAITPIMRSSFIPLGRSESCLEE